MKLDYRELENTDRYRKFFELSHEDLVIFVSEHLRPDNLPMRVFYLLNLPVLAYIFYKLYLVLFVAPLNWVYLITVILLSAILFALLVIPLHEFLHLLAFKLLGAKKTSIHAQWNKMVFYAIADKFVMNSREFLFLALTPFVLLNGLLAAGVVVFHSILRVVSLVFLFLHLTGCIGDFALLGYLFKNRHKRVLNYDDREKGMSYFYEEIG